MDQLEALLNMHREQLTSSDEEVRRVAVSGLGALPLADSRKLLYEALEDESWRIRKEALDILFAGDFRDEYIEELIGLLRSPENAGLRNSACEALERLGNRGVPALCRYIGDEDRDVRKFVIDILGNIGSTASVPDLINALADDDSNVSSAAAESLGKIGDQRAVSPLLMALDSANIPLCHTVLESLGRIGCQVSLERIVALVEEPLLKKPIIDCLGAVGDSNSLPILIEGLLDKSRHVRAAAVSSLVKIRDRLTSEAEISRFDALLKELAGSSFVAELIRSYTASEQQLSEPMIRILGLIGDPRTAQLLLGGCRDGRLRQVCLDAFRGLGQEGISRLIDCFPAADDEQRCYIVYVCGELRVNESLGILLEGMRSANYLLRRVSALAAGSIEDSTIIPALRMLLDDEELDVRLAALESLSRMAKLYPGPVADIAQALFASENAEKRKGSASLFCALQDPDRLARLIKDENAQVRKAAVFALAELKSPASVNNLVLALVDEEPDVRMAAAGALGALGGELAVQSLLLALKDQNQWVKCASLRSLGMLRVTEAVPAIDEVIKNSSGLVLISALRTMLEIDAGTACASASRALDNQDKEVVKAAIEILSYFDGSWLDEYCDRLLCHEYWDVRSLFIKALADHRGKKALPALQKALDRESDEFVKKQIIETMGGLS